MKIYTKTGDDGTTGLLGSGANRVRKSELRVDVYGMVDELNAFVGWATVVANESTAETLRAACKAVIKQVTVTGLVPAVAPARFAAPPPARAPRDGSGRTHAARRSHG